MEDFPDEMSVDDAHERVNEGAFRDFETFDELSVARKAAEALSQGLSGLDTQLYTQVDGEDSDNVVYLKGCHVVNRTGVYLVAWS